MISKHTGHHRNHTPGTWEHQSEIVGFRVRGEAIETRLRNRHICDNSPTLWLVRCSGDVRILGQHEAIPMIPALCSPSSVDDIRVICIQAVHVSSRFYMSVFRRSHSLWRTPFLSSSLVLKGRCLMGLSHCSGARLPHAGSCHPRPACQTHPETILAAGSCLGSRTSPSHRCPQRCSSTPCNPCTTSSATIRGRTTPCRRTLARAPIARSAVAFGLPRSAVDRLA